MNHQDLIGGPGPWGYGGGGYPGMLAFGAEGDPSGQMAPPGMVLPYNGGCYGPAPYVDPSYVAALALGRHAVAFGPLCGPQEVEQMLPFEALPSDLAGASAAGAADGGVVTLEAIPELPAKLVRLFIPTNIATYLAVLNIEIGIKSQLVGTSGPIPALVFCENSTNNRINGDTCQVRQPIKLTIRNVSTSLLAAGNVIGCCGVVAVQGGQPHIYGGPGSGY